MKPLLALAFALVFSARLLSAAPDDFSAANRLYSEGRFAAACAAYERLLRTGATSQALEFNDGNAEFKAGHLGKAIAAYRRAALLAPRDPDVRANLEFARDQVPGAVRRESGWKNWLGLLRLDEWAILAAAAFWLTLLGLSAGQIRPAWRTRLRRPLGAVATVAVLSGAALGWKAADHYRNSTAVVVAPTATARTGPFDGAQAAFSARDGRELRVLDRHDDWLQVSDGAGRSGWIPAAQAEVFPGG